MGGGSHAVSGRGQAVGGGGQTVTGGRSSAGMQRNGNTVRRDAVPVTNSRSFRDDPSGHGDWKHGRGYWKHGHGTAWHRDEHHHRHDRVSFGFFPYWYPSGGYYSYGYPDYSYDYYDYDYPDNDYDSGQNGSASIQCFAKFKDLMLGPILPRSCRKQALLAFLVKFQRNPALLVNLGMSFGGHSLFLIPKWANLGEMINITLLSTSDVGRWVLRVDAIGKRQKGPD
jgi:hypothetical protein